MLTGIHSIIFESSLFINMIRAILTFHITPVNRIFIFLSNLLNASPFIESSDYLKRLAFHSLASEVRTKSKTYHDISLYT